MSNAAATPRTDEAATPSDREALERALGELLHLVRSIAGRLLAEALLGEKVGRLEPSRSRASRPPHQALRRDPPGDALAPGTGSHQAQDALREINAKLVQLEHALASDDEVEADAVRLSLRKAIKAVRAEPALDDLLRLSLGSVYDALTFTDVTAMSTGSVQVLRRSFAALLAEPARAELTTLIRRDLDRAGFQLRPSSIE